MKNAFRIVLTIIFISILIPTTYLLIDQAEGAGIENNERNKVIYNLPYPGILPDHPLYFVKIIRDRINEFLTRDNLKKSQIYLLNSDKRAAMAMALARTGKNKQAIDTFSKAEKYGLLVPQYLKIAKEQGESAPSSFIETAKLSNAKHQELIDEMIKTFPEGMNDQLSALSSLNQQVRLALERL